MLKRKFTHKEVSDYFKDQGCKLLSKEYLGSTAKLKYKCVCGCAAEIEYRLFRSGKRCINCANQRRMTTNKKNHDGKLYFQTSEFIGERKKTYNKIYGVDSPLQNEQIRKKREQTNMDRYGVPHVSQNSVIQKKQVRGLMARNQTEQSLSREKFTNTMLERYGVPNPAYLARSCSRASQNLFWKIHNYLPENIRSKNHFANLNAEFVVSYENKYYKYDFVNTFLRRVIEYNGYNFHPKSSQNGCVFHPTKTVKEAREYEAHKYKAIETRGYTILTVWDYEDFNATIRKCVAFLT